MLVIPKDLSSIAKVTTALVAVAILMVCAPSGGHAEDLEGSGLPLPRFASLRNDEIFVRTGPALQYPIRWVYRKRGLPVEIIRDYDTWRQIRDQDGSTGWVHHAMLSGSRTAVVTGKEGAMVTSSAVGGDSVVRLEKGVVVVLDECEKLVCKVRVSGFKGWLPKTSLWGVYADEEIH